MIKLVSRTITFDKIKNSEGMSCTYIVSFYVLDPDDDPSICLLSRFLNHPFFFLVFEIAIFFDPGSGFDDGPALRAICVLVSSLLSYRALSSPKKMPSRHRSVVFAKNRLKLTSSFSFFFCSLLNKSSIFSGSSSDESDELESDELELELELSESMSEPILSAPFLRNSRSSSVKPPRPIDVKKLMANRVFFGLSFGKMPSKNTCIVSSCRRSFNYQMFNKRQVESNNTFGRPIY